MFTYVCFCMYACMFVVLAFRFVFFPMNSSQCKELDDYSNMNGLILGPLFSPVLKWSSCLFVDEETDSETLEEVLC